MRTLFASPDGEFKVEGSFASKEEAWDYANDVGSRWYFNPIVFVTGEKANRILDVPDGFPKEWIGKTVRRLMTVFKENAEHVCDYANGETPFCIYP